MVTNIQIRDFRDFRDLQIFLPYLHINWLKLPIMIQIIEGENKDTDTSCNNQENNSNEESKRTTIHETI